MIKLEGAKYFYVNEVGKSSTADRKGIDNTPSDIILVNAAALAIHCLDPVREKFGSFGPQSWYRSEELEKEITWKSVPENRGFPGWCNKRGYLVNDKSWDTYFARKSHPRGQAADCEIVGVSNDELFLWCKTNLKFDQLIREFPGSDPMSGWVHISYSLEFNRQQSFTIG